MNFFQPVISRRRNNRNDARVEEVKGDGQAIA